MTGLDRVLITGATGGLGQALVASYANSRTELALQYRSDTGMAQRLVTLAGESGARAVALPQDLAVADIDAEARHFLARVHNELGAVNIAVLNAAAQDVTPWHELSAKDFDDMYQVTFRATAVLLQQLGEQLAELPHDNRVIAVVGSIEGFRPAPGHAPYAVMKAALHHLVKAAAHELGIHGVRVVGAAPGLIDRPGRETDWADGVPRWQLAAALGRPVTALEVAQTIAFLTSPAASGITGVVVPVDAGWSAHPGW